MKVSAREPVAGHRERACEEILHHHGIGVADGVREADAIDACIENGLDEAQNFGRLDATLDRAAERRAEADFDFTSRTGGVTRSANARDLLHDFVGRLAQVGEAMGVARGQRHEHQVGAAFDRPLGAFEVRHEHRSEKSRQRLRERDQFGRVGKLWQEARRNERADLDLALACRPRVANPLDLVLGGQNARDALQAVAQPYLADDDRGDGAHALPPRVHMRTNSLPLLGSTTYL
jgi:hypothetical protein